MRIGARRFLRPAPQAADANLLRSRGVNLQLLEDYMLPETEAKLNDLAARINRPKDELLEEAVNHLLAYNEWLEEKVNRSLAAVERGETVSDDDVRAWVEKRERS